MFLLFTSLFTSLAAELQFSKVILSSGKIVIPKITIEGYSESNYDRVLGPIATLHPSETWDFDSSESQSFIGAPAKVTAVGFYLRRRGFPSGFLYAVLYSHTGILGLNSTPNVELARSDPIDISTIPTSFSLVTFNFSEDQQVILKANVPYCIVLEGPRSGFVDNANCVQIGGDGSSPSHGGNWARYRYGQWWVMNGYDMIFYIFGYSLSLCSIQGRVMYSSNNTPFSGVTVEIVGHSVHTITAQDGTYHFNRLPSRAYTLEFKAVGYRTVRQTVNATAGGSFHLNDVLLAEAPRFLVYGYVKYVNGSVASEVTLYLEGDITYEAVTNIDGLYEFPNVVEGNYLLQVSFSGYRQLGTHIVNVYSNVVKNVTLAPVDADKGIPIPPDGFCYHAAFCSWEDTAAPLPEQARRDIERFASIVGKSLYAAENAGTVCVNEDFWPMREPNSWKPLIEEGLFEVFIFSLFPYLRDYPSDSNTENGPTATEWKIANGTYDDWIRTIAQQTKEFGYPVMLKIGPEMNGNQGPSQPGGSWIADFGANPSAYKAAYRHIVDIFRQEGVDNVVWCISYNFESVGAYDFEDYYSGDEYVDWIGVDVYQISEGDDPAAQLNEFYEWAVTKGKPLAITEWGTNWYYKNIPDADRARYINAFFDEIESKPEYKMIRYHWNSWWRFQDDDPSDYGYLPLTAAAYRNRIANSRYLEYAYQPST